MAIIDLNNVQKIIDQQDRKEQAQREAGVAAIVRRAADMSPDEISALAVLADRRRSEEEKTEAQHVLGIGVPSNGNGTMALPSNGKLPIFDSDGNPTASSATAAEIQASIQSGQISGVQPHYGPDGQQDGWWVPRTAAQAQANRNGQPSNLLALTQAFGAPGAPVPQQDPKDEVPLLNSRGRQVGTTTIAAGEQQVKDDPRSLKALTQAGKTVAFQQMSRWTRA
jgi:hypothetical protein